MRRAAQRDANEPVIVQALEAVGAAVQRLSMPGVPDLLIGYRGRLYLLEVKLQLGPRGGLPESRAHEGGRGDMTAAQVQWWSRWKGPAPVIVRDVAQALAAIGAAAIPERERQLRMTARAAVESLITAALVSGNWLAVEAERDCHDEHETAIVQDELRQIADRIARVR